MIKGSLREANAVMKRNTGKQDSVVLTTCTTGKHDSNAAFKTTKGTEVYTCWQGIPHTNN